MSPLKFARVLLVCTVCNGRLYAVGGSESSEVEEYDFRINKWKTVAPLTVCCRFSQVFTIENDLRVGEVEQKTNQEN